MSLLTKDLQHLSTASVGQVIHNLLKEGETLRYQRDDLIRLCCILSTAEYCLDTVDQLEAKLKEKIDPSLADRIDLADEKDIFHRCISTCIHLLVQDLENGCDPALTVMSKFQWHTIANVGDQSPFVNSLVATFRTAMPVVRDNLSSSRKYYTQFCHKFVNSFIPKYIQQLYKCRPASGDSGSGGGGGGAASSASASGSSCIVNVMGCEQLLLDTHSLKSILLDLPSIGSNVQRKAPASYTKVVVKGMTKAEMIVKVVMVPVVPAAVFIDQFVKLIPDATSLELHKVLDMKGVRRIDQAQLAELFKRSGGGGGGGGGAGGDSLSKQAAGTSNNNSVESVAPPVVSGGGGHIKKLENLIKKRLPN